MRMLIGAGLVALGLGAIDRNFVGISPGAISITRRPASSGRGWPVRADTKPIVENMIAGFREASGPVTPAGEDAVQSMAEAEQS